MPPSRLWYVVQILRYTRHWIHYGTMAFVWMTVLAAAARGLLAK